MQIRSVTIFAHPGHWPARLGAAVAEMRSAFALPVQTIRLATPPYPDWLAEPGELGGVVTRCREAGIDYLAIGPARLDHHPDFLEWLPTLIAGHEMVFASAEIADRSGRIDVERARQVASVIGRLARVRADGFANLFFTANANCPPGSPFFPVAYHDGGPAGFAIATEAAALAVETLQSSGSLAEAQEKLVAAIEREAAGLTETAESLAARHGLVFGGIDFSLAPYPEDARSLGTALETMGIAAVGAHGSLFAAALLASCVDQARFPRCGFSGLMFPVLEDAVLARRAAEGTLTVNDLLLYSAVCGAGLDVLPLPGEVEHDVLTAILLDLAALAVRLDKPLTARLMPLPGLTEGDAVAFDFPYFAASRVMGTRPGTLTGLVRGRVVLQHRIPR